MKNGIINYLNFFLTCVCILLAEILRKINSISEIIEDRKDFFQKKILHQ